MFEDPDKCRDLRSLSLQLYDKVITVYVKENTDSYTKYGKEIEGRLIGRIWGSKNINGQELETVIALHVLHSEKEILIPCDDIELMREAE